MPSRLQLKQSERTIQVQFTGFGFDIVLFDRGNAACRAASFSAADLRNVTLELRQAECPPIKLLYANRTVIIELNGRSWGSVPDMQFMRLIEMAVDGMGAHMDLEGNPA